MTGTGRPKLLLVADNAAAAEAARRLLEEGGEIVAATTVDQAVPHLSHESIDLIIALDVPPSRVLKLLRLVQETPAGRGGVPVTFVDLTRLRHRHGTLAADREVCRLVGWQREAQAA
jgi:CheY-like chemotaxis protein